tara:strand:+ start:989 stop:1354 length:366 start_codon:yes stop_codon:yes gene_type:complete
MEIESKEDLKNNLSLYLKLKDEEDELKNRLSKLKSKSENIHDSILNYMNEKDILDKELIFDKRKIKCANNKISESITKKLLLDRLTTYFENEKRAHEVTNFIYNNRKSTNKILLKVSNLKT